MNDKDKIEKREIFFRGIVIMFFVTLLLRLFYIQVLDGERYKTKAKENRQKVVRIESQRGRIYDKDGNLLATNEIGYRVSYLKGREIKEEDVKVLSDIFGYDREYIEKRIKYGEIIPYTNENLILEDVDREGAHKFLEVSDRYPDIKVTSYGKRYYTYGESASHILGYTKKISSKEYEELKNQGYSKRDVIGKAGVEKYYDKKLQGNPGYEVLEVNALNKKIKILEKKEPVSGKDLYLSIDMGLQRHIENEFRRKRLVGSFIAIDPKSGKILTMVSYPNYPLNKMASRINEEDWVKIRDDERKPLRDRAVGSTYAPGSIFKPLMAMALLRDGLDPNETYSDKDGLYHVGKGTWRAWKRGGHGETNLAKAIRESANPYFYYYGEKLGVDKIVEASKEMGLGRKTGVDISREKAGLLADKAWKKEKLNERWYTGDTINLSIGQGYLAVTALQMAEVYCVIANRGYAYKPRVNDKFVSGDNIEKTPKEKIIEVDYKDEWYDDLQLGMIGAVERKGGTASALRTNGLKIAAKTGTAENYGYERSHAWTAGYFPVEDPKIVFVSFVEAGGGGGHIAAPIAKSFIDSYLKENSGLTKTEEKNDKQEGNRKKRDGST